MFVGKWKQHSLGKLGFMEIEHLEICEKSGKLFYRFNLLRNYRLCPSMTQSKLQDVDKTKQITKEINRNAIPLKNSIFDLIIQKYLKKFLCKYNLA